MHCVLHSATRCGPGDSWAIESVPARILGRAAKQALGCRPTRSAAVKDRRCLAAGLDRLGERLNE